MSHSRDGTCGFSRPCPFDHLDHDRIASCLAAIRHEALRAAIQLDAAKFITEAALMGRTELALVETSLVQTAPHAAPDLKRLTDAFTSAGVISILKAMP